jgi:hypothetical protein
VIQERAEILGELLFGRFVTQPVVECLLVLNQATFFSSVDKGAKLILGYRGRETC